MQPRAPDPAAVAPATVPDGASPEPTGLAEGRRAKPALRGVFHLAAVPLALAGAIALVATAGDAEARIALGIYGAALVGLFGVSALYHRVHWSPGPRQWVRRIDHSMIFILTAATYTPFAVLVIDSTLGDVLLGILWVGAAGGVLLNLLWPEQPKWAASVAACALGPPLLVSLVPLGRAAGIGASALVAAGLFLYAAGALVYGAQRPDPWPRRFGYHEIMHLLVVAAAAFHYVAVAVYATPTG